MLTQKIKGAKNLREYHDSLVLLKEANIKLKAEKKGLIPLTLKRYHGLIQQLMQESDSYTEFGVYQGPTLAAAMFTNPKKIRAYDITLEWFNHAKNLFTQYANEHNIDFKVFEDDTSTCSTIEPTDMLHIDSKHTYDHAWKELNRHAKQVQKYMLFHDTTLTPGVWEAIQKYIHEVDNSWTVVERCEDGVGYTLLKRK